jgi:anti-sigma factor RsiW
LDCREYISEYLAGHADGELAPLARRGADEHVSGCPICRAQLIEARALKAMVRQGAAIVKTPADLKSRIRGALDEADRRAAAPWTARLAELFAPFRAAASRVREPLIWAPAGLAAVIAIAILAAIAVPRRGLIATPPPVPEFELAISRFQQFQHDFVPNVPAEAYENQTGAVYAWVINRDPVHRVTDEADSDAFNDLARSYRSANLPDDLFDFAQAGYTITGGRVDQLPDGQPIAYTLYEGAAGEIVSLCFYDPTMAAPIGALNWLGLRSFYEYKGYSICLSFYPTGHFISILITRMPVTQLMRDVAFADPSGISR